MRQFDQCNYGQADFGVGDFVGDGGKRLPGVLALALRRRGRWSRGSVPCGRAERFAMALNGRFHIFGEVRIDGSRRVFGK